MKYLKYIVIILCVALTSMYFIWRSPYCAKRYYSPQKNFVLEVWAYKSYAQMPGDAYSQSGFILLKDSGGRVLEKQDISLISSVDKIYWDDNEVDIVGVTNWELPEGYMSSKSDGK